jgi:hypothetical protein
LSAIAYIFVNFNTAFLLKCIDVNRALVAASHGVKITLIVDVDGVAPQDAANLKCFNGITSVAREDFVEVVKSWLCGGGIITLFASLARLSLRPPPRRVENIGGGRMM